MTTLALTDLRALTCGCVVDVYGRIADPCASIAASWRRARRLYGTCNGDTDALTREERDDLSRQCIAMENHLRAVQAIVRPP